MFLCLSSGQSVRYRLDVLRALSMPPGTYLQFRYDLKYVAPGVRAACEKEFPHQKQALIAYIDQADKSRAPEIVPVRFATVQDGQILGTTISLRLCLEQFAQAEQLDAFNSEVSQISAGTIPQLQTDGKIKGFYWAYLNAEPRTVIRSSTASSWQEIAGQLAAHQDFGSEEFFISVVGLKRDRWGKGRAILPTQGEFRLDPAKTYSLQIYQFHPRTTPINSLIQLSPSATALQVTSEPSLAVDSRYDHKQVSLKTSALMDEERVRLRISCRNDETKSDGLYFDLACTVKGSRKSSIAYAFILAAALAAPNLLALFSNPNISKEVFPYAVIINIAASVLAAVVAVYRIRKLL